MSDDGIVHVIDIGTFKVKVSCTLSTGLKMQSLLAGPRTCVHDVVALKDGSGPSSSTYVQDYRHRQRRWLSPHLGPACPCSAVGDSPGGGGRPRLHEPLADDAVCRRRWLACLWRRLWWGAVPRAWSHLHVDAGPAVTVDGFHGGRGRHLVIRV